MHMRMACLHARANPLLLAATYVLYGRRANRYRRRFGVGRAERILLGHVSRSTAIGRAAIDSLCIHLAAKQLVVGFFLFFSFFFLPSFSFFFLYLLFPSFFSTYIYRYMHTYICTCIHHTDIIQTSYITYIHYIHHTYIHTYLIHVWLQLDRLFFSFLFRRVLCK